MQKISDYNQFWQLRWIYTVAFTIYLALGKIVPYACYINTTINQGFYILFAVSGVLLVMYDLIHEKILFQSKYNTLLFIFLIVCCISSLLNISYGFIENVKTIVWTVIQFYLLYAVDLHLGIEQIRHQVMVIISLLSIIWGCCAIISIIQYVLQIHYVVSAVPFDRRQGFMDARLFGIFTDPNYASVISFLVILGCIYCISFVTLKWQKILYVFSVVVQVAYILLSGSRTIEIASVVASAIVFWLLLRNYFIFKTNKAFLHKRVFAIFGSLICCLLLVGFLWGFKQGLSHMHISVQHTVSEDKHFKFEQEDVLDRPDVGNKNISNNRFKIWKGAVELVKYKPVFGMSPRNMVRFARSKHPENYIARTGYRTHNAYINILAGTGVVGLLVMIAFIICIIKYVFGYIHKKKDTPIPIDIIFIFGIVAMFASEACFLTDLFFVNNISSTMFWLFMGYLMVLISQDKEKCSIPETEKTPILYRKFSQYNLNKTK